MITHTKKIIGDPLISTLHTQQEYFQVRKSNASDNDGDKTVRCELYHGSYVTEDYEVALLKYLVHLSSRNYVMMEMDVEEELNERVNGGD